VFSPPTSPVAGSSKCRSISYTWVCFHFVRVCFGAKQKRASAHHYNPTLPPGLRCAGGSGLPKSFCGSSAPSWAHPRDHEQAGCLEPGEAPLACCGICPADFAADVLHFQALVLAKSEGDLSSTNIAGGSLVPDEDICHHLPACFSGCAVLAGKLISMLLERQRPALVS